MDLTHLGSILPTVLTLTTILGVAAAGLQRGLLQNYKESAEVRAQQREDAERDRDRYKAESERKDAVIAAKDSDIAALSRVVTGEAYLTALGDKLDEHHSEARAYWTADAKISEETLAVLKRLSGGT